MDHGSATETADLAEGHEAPFVAAIRRLLARKGLTIEELVDATRAADATDHDRRGRGISRPTLYRLFRGETQPDLRTIRLLARAFGVPTHWLIVEGGFFALRQKNWRNAIREVDVGKEPNRPHWFLLKQKVYKYAALDQAMAREQDQYGYGTDDGWESERTTQLSEVNARAAWPRAIQSYVFEVSWASDGDLAKGLSAHEGEEVLFVIEGELEAWFWPPNSDIRKPPVLKQGDVLQYPSYIPHGFRCPNKGASAKALFCFVWRGDPHEPHVTPRGFVSRRTH